MTNTENFTPNQIAVIADYVHGDGITTIEQARDGAITVHFEAGPPMTVDRDGTVRDDVR